MLGKAFEISLTFTLLKNEQDATTLIYEGSNKGVNFIGRAMMKLSSQKGNDDVVKEFLQRVQTEAMKGS